MKREPCRSGASNWAFQDRCGDPADAGTDRRLPTPPSPLRAERGEGGSLGSCSEGSSPRSPETDVRRIRALNKNTKPPLSVAERGSVGGGGGGIRTPGTREGPPVFETGAFDQALPPHRRNVVRQARRSVQSGLHDHPRLVPPLAGASLKKGVKGPRPPLRLASHRRPPTTLVLPPDNCGDILPNRRQGPLRGLLRQGGRRDQLLADEKRGGAAPVAEGVGEVPLLHAARGRTAVLVGTLSDPLGVLKGDPVGKVGGRTSGCLFLGGWDKGRVRGNKAPRRTPRWLRVPTAR